MEQLNANQNGFSQCPDHHQSAEYGLAPLFKLAAAGRPIVPGFHVTEFGAVELPLNARWNALAQ